MNLTEQRQLFELILGGDPRARSAAIATIVRTQGSTYRRPGARLLVDADGPIMGNLSGGCLEGEMTIEAERVLDTKTPALLTYDLSGDDEAIWGWGLGCNGTMEVFIEPAASWSDAARVVAPALNEGRAVAVVTMLASSDGDLAASRCVIASDGSVMLSSGEPAWDEQLAAKALHALTDRRHRLMTVDGTRVFVEALVPRDVVVLCGAGHDAIPVASVCADLGFEVVVVDDRKAFLNEDRFPDANVFLSPTSLPELHMRYPDARMHAIVMTHNYLRDVDLLTALSASRWSYVGVLGPHRRLERLMRDLQKKGVEVDEEWAKGLHGPAGLDLGAEGPEEIAIAIAAELLAVRNGRGGGFLRDRSRPIHDA